MAVNEKIMRVYIGIQLRKIMNERGVTLAWLAEQVDLTHQAVSLWVNGINLPPLTGLYRACIALKVPLEYLLPPLPFPTDDVRIFKALETAKGSLVDDAPHKQFVIDRMVRHLLGPDMYIDWVHRYNELSETLGLPYWDTGNQI